jgi:hypothetical protein
VPIRAIEAVAARPRAVDPEPPAQDVDHGLVSRDSAAASRASTLRIVSAFIV